ncbi:hypothetical protein BJX61DRAFT_539760 [Aspergillus egyptiacus]|nr:hypothetical protein BJX61DRAFT_539760 [Aspergillus egyptiacus]
MTSPTPHPTIPSPWAPTGAGCHAKNDFWIWDYHSANDKKTVLGGPSQLDASATCYPSSWAPTYQATQCPNGYTSACRADNPTDPVTCCPTAYPFSCVEGASTIPHGSWFQCIWQFTRTADMTVTRTDMIVNTITFEPTPIETHNHLFALPIVYATATGDAVTNPTDPPVETSPTPGSSSGSSISAGAAAGIGIGCAAGVVLLAMLAWVIYLRKRKSTVVVAAPPPSDHHPGGVYEGKERIFEARQPSELAAQGPRRELEG